MISDKHDKFIELRAQGWTLGHIATELHMSKRTMVDWNSELADQVQSLRADELELLKEKFLASREEELSRLTRLQKDVEDELASRPLKFIPIDKLFQLATELRKQIHELREEPEPETETSRSRSRSGRNQHHGNGCVVGGNGRTTSHELAENRPVTPALSTPITPRPSDGRGIEGEGLLGEGTGIRAGFEEEREAPVVASHVSSADALASDPPSPPAAQQQIGNPPEPEKLTPNSPSDRKTESVVEPGEPSKNPAERSPEEGPTQNLTHPDNNPLEHCLTCGAELPALLPNGKQPSQYCKCGQSLSLPGLNLREHCWNCEVPVPVHGYNAKRLSEFCKNCDISLPPLDPKSITPWLPPSVT